MIKIIDKQKTKIRVDQSVVNSEEIVEFTNFKPFDNSLCSDTDISQSIVNVKGIKMIGDFAPKRCTKKIPEKEKVKEKQNTNEFELPNKLFQIKREVLVKWTRQGFSEKEAEEWIKAGFTTNDFSLISFLRHQLGYQSPTEALEDLALKQILNISELRTDYQLYQWILSE